ncbi:phosphatase [Planococcus lenghuensis]|uniref:Phosphatase n=1 Tax=Planococcus lenghuensis TaxID=2213202 RepID=A0A1Q2KWN2_9BACL|nr:phosphatase [Planococcus lenghuensis]AQQ52536.1 phosphatase [Planococcus lenghuensis]
MNKHTVYFLSSHQQRGMMAEIWANCLRLPDWEIRSAAWKQPIWDNTTIEIMQEILLDFPEIRLTPYNPMEVGGADLVIVLYDSEYEQLDLPPDLPESNLLLWDICNPALRTNDEIEKWVLYQEVCDEIAQNVKKLEPVFRFQYM